MKVCRLYFPGKFDRAPVSAQFWSEKLTDFFVTYMFVVCNDLPGERDVTSTEAPRAALFHNMKSTEASRSALFDNLTSTEAPRAVLFHNMTSTEAPRAALFHNRTSNFDRNFSQKFWIRLEI